MNQVLKCKEIPKTWFKNLLFFFENRRNISKETTVEEIILIREVRSQNVIRKFLLCGESHLYNSFSTLYWKLNERFQQNVWKYQPVKE